MKGFHFDPYKDTKDKRTQERAAWKKVQPKWAAGTPDGHRKGGLGKRKPRPVTLAKMGEPTLSAKMKGARNE